MGINQNGVYIFGKIVFILVTLCDIKPVDLVSLIPFMTTNKLDNV